jgi:TonB family protein
MALKATIAVLLFAWCASAATTTETAHKHQTVLTPQTTTHMSLAQSAEAGPIRPVDKNSDERPAAFGDLAVRTTGLEVSSITYAPDSRRIAVSLIVNNTGNNAVCATFTAKLKTTSGVEYRGTSIQAPSMREMLPGDRARGSYIFEVREGDQPLELILNLDGGTIRCKSSSEEPLRDASIPGEIRLDVHDLAGSRANSFRPEGALRSATGGGAVSFPVCIYCPSPNYTPKARHAKLEGTVLLNVVVEPDGNPGNIEILKGIGDGLDEEAVNAVRTWRFRPKVGPNGEPVEAVVPIEIGFRLPK